jgi:hypothetical protein
LAVVYNIEKYITSAGISGFAAVIGPALSVYGFREQLNGMESTLFGDPGTFNKGVLITVIGLLLAISGTIICFSGLHQGIL